MGSIVIIFTVIALVLLIIGLIKPKLIIRWKLPEKKKPRLAVIVVALGFWVLGIMISSIFVPDREKEEPVSATKLTSNQENPSGQLIYTKEYFPLEQMVSRVVRYKGNMDENYFWEKNEGKMNIQGKDLYAISRYNLLNEPRININNYMESWKDYGFYTIDADGNINKIGSGKPDKPSWFSNPSPLLLGKMEVNKDYVVRQDNFGKVVLKCLGKKDINIEEKAYQDVLVIERLNTTYFGPINDPKQKFMEIRSTSYYGNGIGLLKEDEETQNADQSKSLYVITTVTVGEPEKIESPPSKTFNFNLQDKMAQLKQGGYSIEKEDNKAVSFENKERSVRIIFNKYKEQAETVSLVVSMDSPENMSDDYQAMMTTVFGNDYTEQVSRWVFNADVFKKALDEGEKKNDLLPGGGAADTIIGTNKIDVIYQLTSDGMVIAVMITPQ